MFQGTSRFRILKALGRGGTGVVYRTFDAELGREVALKTLVEPGRHDLKEEFRKLAGILHPNLVELHELFATGEEPYFTMELVEGHDFIEHVRGTTRSAGSARGAAGESDEIAPTVPAEPVGEETVPLPSETTDLTRTIDSLSSADPPRRPLRPPAAASPEALFRLEDVLAQLVLGISVLHGHGVAHLDLKPSNVLVTERGRLVILDLGLAAHLNPRDRYYRPYARGGTPGYMAPEQIWDNAPKPASDWYSLGVMLYEALTGRLPFDPRDPAVLLRMSQRDAPPPHELSPAAPRALSALAMALLQVDPARRAGGDDILRALPGRGARVAAEVRALVGAARRSFVGREAETARLHAALAGVATGQPVVVRLSGPSGIGKTELVQRFLGALEGNPLVLQGRCRPQESVLYNAFDDLVDDLAGALRDLPEAEVATLAPEHGAALLQLFPALRQVPGLSSRADPPADLEPQAQRRRGFAALGALLGNLARGRLVVLWIDDAQWGDADSSLLLRELLDPPRAPPLLFLISHRSGDAEGGPLLRALHAAAGELPAGHLVEIALGPLDERASRELATALLGAEGAAHAAEVAREASGFPFFIGELSHAFAQRPAAGEAAPSARIADVLGQRLGRLSGEERAILEAMAVAGGPLLQSLLLQAAEVGEGSRLTVARLGGQRLLRLIRLDERPAVEAYHDRIREAVLARMTPADRRARHLRLAEALAAAPGADPEALLLHYAAGGDAARAGRHALHAADRAAAALAFDRAAKLYRKALDLGISEAPRSHLLASLGGALAQAGRGAEAAPRFMEAAAALAEEAGPAGAPGEDAEGRASRVLDLRRRAAEQYLRSGLVDEGTSVMRAVLESVGARLPESPWRAAATMLRHRTRFLARGFAVEPRDGPPPPRAALARLDALWSGATSLSMTSHAVADALGVQHLVEALAVGERSRVARALGLEATFEAGLGGRLFRARSARMLVTVRRLAAESGDPYDLAWAEMAVGTSAWLRADWALAASACDAAADLFHRRCRGVAWEIATNQVYALSALAQLGRLRELAARVPRVLRDAEERGDLYAANNARLGQPSLVWLAQGRADHAFALAREAEVSWRTGAFHTQRYHHLLGTTQAALYAGDALGALRRVEDAWPRLRAAHFLLLECPRVELRHLKARAALAAAAASAVDRERHLAVAVGEARWIERDRVPLAAPFAALIRAGVARLGGDDPSARSWLARAAIDLDRAGMALYREAARYRLGALQGGAAGERLQEASAAWMEAEGVLHPEAMVEALTPGCGARRG